MTGEVGTGKTTLLRMLMKNLEATVRFAYLYNTTLGFEDLLAHTCDELDIKVEGEGRLKRIQALNAFLIEQLRRGGTGVLLIDEAQNLGSDVLENLRLLSNLETSTEKLLQIVLVGQPELGAKLADPGLRQLRQRVSVQCRLDRLKDREVEAYVRFRLETAGAQRTDLFDGRALERIAFYSTGIPRLINIICDNGLTIAYATSVKRVSAAVVEEVAADLGLKAAPAPERPPAPVLPTEVKSDIPAAASTSTATRTTAEVMRRRSHRRPPRRRWFAWARLGALAVFVLAGSGALLSMPSVIAHLSGPGTSIKSAWGLLTTRAVLARPRETAASVAPSAPPEPVAAVGRASGGPESTAVASPSPPAVAPEAVHAAPVPSLPPRPSEPPRTASESGRTGTERPGAAKPRPIVIPHGATIADIAFKTYGGYNILAIDLIKEFNPHIANLNWIVAGDQLRLPSLDADTLIRKQSNGSYRLIVGSFLSNQAAERTRDRVRRAGYDIEVTTRRLTDNLEVHRVEIVALQTREVAQQAWNTALANCWLQITDTPCERTNHG